MYLVSHVGGRQGVVVNNVGPGGIRGHLHNLCDQQYGTRERRFKKVSKKLV